MAAAAQQGEPAQQQAAADAAAGGPRLGVLLTISSPALEQRFWWRRCTARLVALDALFELCNAVLWLSILPSLSGSERQLGKARLVLAAGQLAATQLAPQLWLRHRSALLSAAHLLRCSLLLPCIGLGQPAGAAASGGLPDAAAGSSAAAVLLASNFWGHMLFVLFHQQPIALQAPLLAVSCALQTACAVGALSRSCSGAGGGGAGVLQALLSAFTQHGDALASLNAALHWGFDQLAAGSFGSALPAGGLSQLALQPAAALLTTRLFLHVFGDLLLPLFVAYMLEWRFKVAFLLSEAKEAGHGGVGRAAQLAVLTPAAAIVRGSGFLSLLLYTGWLLLLAVVCWVSCATAAALLLARGGA